MRSSSAAGISGRVGEGVSERGCSSDGGSRWLIEMLGRSSNERIDRLAYFRFAAPRTVYFGIHFSLKKVLQVDENPVNSFSLATNQNPSNFSHDLQNKEVNSHDYCLRGLLQGSMSFNSLAPYSLSFFHHYPVSSLALSSSSTSCPT